MTTASPSGAAFVFPREYYFPPFFTRQTNLTTHHAQLTKWSALVLSYCRHYRIFKLSLSSTSPSSTTTTTTSSSSLIPSNPSSTLTGTTSTTSLVSTATTLTANTATSTTNTEELFHNRKLNRRLNLSDIREVIDFLVKDGRAEYVGDSKSGDIVWVYWRTPEEWAALIESWVDETAQRGTVLTLYELTQGENTRGTEFYGLDPELLQKALQILVKRSKAQIFGQEDSLGVKFF
ncbi:vacuolar protein-sorting-associated protein 25 [Diplogelasinospora grovesii]|uniref:ESCRT-II complex subunit VPS25 n=1 Tax=Diplogelasinospora grovesii TaxID=303347 RepID=A0AAN6N9D8_9PEZI|nr:vacuolar protein-sorting-associated protein 25 [Diplogelasinospora grovesii]